MATWWQSIRTRIHSPFESSKENVFTALLPEFQSQDVRNCRWDLPYMKCALNYLPVFFYHRDTFVMKKLVSSDCNFIPLPLCSYSVSWEVSNFFKPIMKTCLESQKQISLGINWKFMALYCLKQHNNFYLPFLESICYVHPLSLDGNKEQEMVSFTVITTTTDPAKRWEFRKSTVVSFTSFCFQSLFFLI